MDVNAETFSVTTENHVAEARIRVKQHARKVGLGIVDDTKLVTAVSEIARNMVLYGGGGVMHIEDVVVSGRPGVKVTFEDKGPGIPDLEQAMGDGFTTGGGMGLGLPGSKRLVNEFKIESKAGEGTKVELTKWK
jgi:Anti-sigma regulatory factor (Ser/Thr protein kinase)